MPVINILVPSSVRLSHDLQNRPEFFGIYLATARRSITRLYRYCSFGIAGPAPEYAKIIQGTIAAAAVINEIIAVIVTKKGFEWSGEFHKGEQNDTVSADRT